jgi:hypothetical protein
MVVLPWKGRMVDSEGEELVASVTRLRLARWRDVPRLLVIALRLRRRFPLGEGGLAVGLAAQPLRRTFWTLTLWRDDTAVLAYMRSRDHADAIGALRGALADTASARWPTRHRPTWREARQHLGLRRSEGQHVPRTGV